MDVGARLEGDVANINRRTPAMSASNPAVVQATNDTSLISKHSAAVGDLHRFPNSTRPLHRCVALLPSLQIESPPPALLALAWRP
jgi:predicted deacylase